MTPVDPAVRRRRGLITIVVMMATIMHALDGTIANVALPSIQGSLSASLLNCTNWTFWIWILSVRNSRNEKRASPVRLSLKSGTSSKSSPMLPEISTMSCTSTVCNVPIGTVRVLGSATSGRDRVLVEIVEQREAVLPVRRLVELDGEDLTVDAVDIAGRTHVHVADQHAAGESKQHIGAPARSGCRRRSSGPAYRPGPAGRNKATGPSLPVKLRDELNVPTITLVTVFGPFSSVSKPVTSVVSSLPAGSCNRTGSCSSSTTPVTAPVAYESGKRCCLEATTDAFLAARRDRSLNF